MIVSSADTKIRCDKFSSTGSTREPAFINLYYCSNTVDYNIYSTKYGFKLGLNK